MVSAFWQKGYPQPHDSVTQLVAGWSAGSQNFRHEHKISGSKSRWSRQGANRAVTAAKAKAEVEAWAGGAPRWAARWSADVPSDDAEGRCDAAAGEATAARVGSHGVSNRLNGQGSKLNW